MKIQPLYLNNNSRSQSAFQGLHVIDTNVQALLLQALDSKQLESVSGIIKEQESNSVHILLGSKNGGRLNAVLMSDYRIQNFNTTYNQRPFFESKFQFIKRVANVANEYKKQIQDFDVLKLRWDYNLLPEWIKKMHL